MKVVRKIASVEKGGGSKERKSKNNKINGISVEVGDRVTIMAGQSKQITGVVSAISKKGSVKLNKYGKWAKIVETNSDDATRDVWERDSEKKLRSRTESSVNESQRTLPLNVAISKKGTVKLNQYGKWAKVMETNSDDATRDVWERDSEKK